MSYAAPCWAMMRPAGQCSMLWAPLQPSHSVHYWTTILCTLLSHAAPRWAMLHTLCFATTEPCCTLLSYSASCWANATPRWAMLHLAELWWALLSNAARSDSSTKGPRCTLLSYAAPFWAMLHSLSYWATMNTTELFAPRWATLYPVSYPAPCTVSQSGTRTTGPILVQEQLNPILVPKCSGTGLSWQKSECGCGFPPRVYHIQYSSVTWGCASFLSIYNFSLVWLILLRIRQGWNRRTAGPDPGFPLCTSFLHGYVRVRRPQSADWWSKG